MGSFASGVSVVTSFAWVVSFAWVLSVAWLVSLAGAGVVSLVVSVAATGLDFVAGSVFLALLLEVIILEQEVF